MTIAIAKSNDKLRKQNDKLMADAEQAGFEKRAEAELPHLPGDAKVRASLIKAIEALRTRTSGQPL